MLLPLSIGRYRFKLTVLRAPVSRKNSPEYEKYRIEIGNIFRAESCCLRCYKDQYNVAKISYVHFSHNFAQCIFKFSNFSKLSEIFDIFSRFISKNDIQSRFLKFFPNRHCLLVTCVNFQFLYSKFAFFQ